MKIYVCATCVVLDDEIVDSRATVAAVCFVAGGGKLTRQRRIAQEHITFELYPQPESADFFGRNQTRQCSDSDGSPTL